MKNYIRIIYDGLMNIIIAVLVSLLTPTIIGLRLLIAKNLENYNISYYTIFIIFLIVGAIFTTLVIYFRIKIYDPIKFYLEENKEEKYLRLFKNIALIIIIFHICTITLGTQVFVSLYLKYFNKEYSKANELINNMEEDPLPNEKELLKDAIIFVDNSSNVRKIAIDRTHSLDLLKVDIIWTISKSLWIYEYRGRTLNTKGKEKVKRVLRTLHWADIPVWEFRNCIDIYDILNNKKMEYDIKRKAKKESNKRPITYYVTTIKGVDNEFGIREYIDWPCGLWRDPDGIAIDCSRYNMGIEKLEVNVITDTGVTLTRVYKAVLNKEKKIVKIEKEREYEGSDEMKEMMNIYNSNTEIYKMKISIEKPDPNGLYFIIIHKRDTKRSI